VCTLCTLLKPIWELVFLFCVCFVGSYLIASASSSDSIEKLVPGVIYFVSRWNVKLCFSAVSALLWNAVNVRQKSTTDHKTTTRSQHNTLSNINARTYLLTSLFSHSVGLRQPFCSEFLIRSQSTTSCGTCANCPCLWIESMSGSVGTPQSGALWSVKREQSGHVSVLSVPLTCVHGRQQCTSWHKPVTITLCYSAYVFTSCPWIVLYFSKLRSHQFK